MYTTWVLVMFFFQMLHSLHMQKSSLQVREKKLLWLKPPDLPWAAVSICDSTFGNMSPLCWKGSALSIDDFLSFKSSLLIVPSPDSSLQDKWRHVSNRAIPHAPSIMWHNRCAMALGRYEHLRDDESSLVLKPIMCLTTYWLDPWMMMLIYCYVFMQRYIFKWLLVQRGVSVPHPSLRVRWSHTVHYGRARYWNGIVIHSHVLLQYSVHQSMNKEVTEIW